MPIKNGIVEYNGSASKAYGLMMAKSTYLGTRSLLNGQRPFVLTRASYSGVQKYSAQWTGDNVSSDEHMLLAFRLLNSMGVSGIPFTGMDIGGFVGNPTPELFIRWMSLGVYSPLYRNHTNIEYSYREPWLLSAANTALVRASLERRYKLLPYLYSTFYQAHETGLPINRMLPIAYTYDDKVYNTKYQNQFLFGDALMVCPVESNKMAVETYFPGKTKWYRLSNDEVVTGSSSQWVAAPLNDLPVFVKESSIVPMQSVIQSTKEKGDGILYLHVWKGSSASVFKYYEDDGETYQYETGAYYKRTITYNPTENTLTLSPVTGTYKSRFESVRVVLHGFDKKSLEDVKNTREAIRISL